MAIADSGTTDGMTQRSDSWLRRHGHAALLVAFGAGAIVTVMALPRWVSAPAEDAPRQPTSGTLSTANAGDMGSDSELSTRPEIEAYLERKGNELVAGIVGPDRARVLVGADLEPIVGTASSIRRMTVSVLLDTRLAATTEAPWSVESLNSMRAVVGNALGVDETRGDEIAVLAIPFDGGPRSEPKLASIVQHIEPLGKPLLALLGMALAFLLGLRATDAISAHAAAVRGYSSATSVDDSDPTVTTGIPNPSAARDRGEPASVATRMPAYTELMHRTSEDPGRTARALRTWMSRP